jgi:hypothetical protein
VGSTTNTKLTMPALSKESRMALPLSGTTRVTGARKRGAVAGTARHTHTGAGFSADSDVIFTFNDEPPVYPYLNETRTVWATVTINNAGTTSGLVTINGPGLTSPLTFSLPEDDSTPYMKDDVEIELPAPVDDYTYTATIQRALTGEDSDTATAYVCSTDTGSGPGNSTGGFRITPPVATVTPGDQIPFFTANAPVGTTITWGVTGTGSGSFATTTSTTPASDIYTAPTGVGAKGTYIVHAHCLAGARQLRPSMWLI